MKINLWGWFTIFAILGISFTLITSNSVVEVLRSGFMLITFILLMATGNNRT